MIQVESLLLEHYSIPSSELCSGLADIVQVENGGSPASVKCSRKVYYSIVRHIDSVSYKKKL